MQDLAHNFCLGTACLGTLSIWLLEWSRALNVSFANLFVLRQTSNNIIKKCRENKRCANNKQYEQKLAIYILVNRTIGHWSLNQLLKLRKNEENILPSLGFRHH